MDADKLGWRDEETLSWKNWDLAIPQIVLIVAGGYYIHQAVIMLWSRVDSLENVASSVISMMVEIILFGLAIMLQEICKYRERKR